MTVINKRKLGQEKEVLAAEYLTEQGYHVLERNFYSRAGEIDIIAQDKEYLVFIEVKYRKNAAAGHPEEAVTKAKQRRLVMAARYYLTVRRLPQAALCRFDVVAITGEKIRLIRDAFWAF